MRANRNVADELPAHGLAEEPIELLLVLLVRRSSVIRLLEPEVPVLLRPGRTAARAYGEVMSRPEQVHVAEQRPVREDVLEREVLEQVRGAQVSPQLAVLEHRLDLGSKQERVREVGVVQR